MPQNHFAMSKMIACKGIFATTSIDTAIKRPIKVERLLGILYNKIPYVSIIKLVYDLETNYFN